MEKCPRCKSLKPEGMPCLKCGTELPSATPTGSIPSGIELHNMLKGQKLGPYKILELIAEGGMGRIYKALHTTLFTYVAVKVLSLEQIARDPNILDRFIQEAQLTAKLRHPNIVTVYHAGQENGAYYIAMDLIQGRTLADILSEKKLSVQETLRIIKDTVGALQYAHEQNIIHRDIKPSNIMLDHNNTTYIMDFGLAKDTRLNLALTQSGCVVGSPYYMSPEQAQGQKLNHRSDIFSLGAVFYEMLTFTRPFQGKSSLELIQKVTSANPTPIRQLAPHVHRDIETICMKCLEKLPYARYQSAAEIARDIQSFSCGEVICARPATRLYRLWKWMKRNRMSAVFLTIAGLCLILAALFSLSVYHINKTDRERQRRREMCEHLQFIARQIAKEIENTWIYVISDARVLAKTQGIIAMMANPGEYRLYSDALEILQLWSETKGYMAIFLLDCQGNCIISSDKKFEQKNYSFRPYYQQAVAGRENIFYAIGTVSGKPGYYCGIPCYKNDKLIGVCAIKFALNSMSYTWKHTIFHSERIFLAEENGVLIQDNYSDAPLLYLFPLSQATLTRIESSRQFLGRQLQSLGLQLNAPLDLRQHQILQLPDQHGKIHLTITAPLQKFSYSVLMVVEYQELCRICENWKQ